MATSNNRRSFSISSFNMAAQAAAYEEDYIISLLEEKVDYEEEWEEDDHLGYFDNLPKVKGLPGLEALHKLAQLELIQEKTLEKWKQGNLPWQEVMFLLAAQYGAVFKKAAFIISPSEWEKRQLNKETLIKLGLKGSPKLSKALVQLGLPNKVMELFLSASLSKNNEKLSKGVTQVRSDYLACSEQGNSIYYASCQATNPKAAWEGNNQYNQIPGDIEYFGKSLFLWVVGDCMKLNGEGFKARAKVRIMYTDREATKVAGLYIDRPYGQHSLLMDNLHELEEWWNEYCEEFYQRTYPLFMPPVWNRDNGAGNDFQSSYGGYYPRKLYCPSAQGGYQDTLTRGLGGYDCFNEVGSKSSSLIKQAYLLRKKTGGAYKVPLIEVKYNPQKGGLVTPVDNNRPWRGVIDKRARYQIAQYIQVIGKPESKFILGTSWYNDNVECTLFGERVKFSSQESGWSVKSRWTLELLDHHCKLIEGVVNNDGSKEMEVISDFPILGFYKAVELPYYNMSSDYVRRVWGWGNPLIVKPNKEIEEKAKNFGWAEAQPIAIIYLKKDIFHRRTTPMLLVDLDIHSSGIAKAIGLPYEVYKEKIEVKKDIPEGGWYVAETIKKVKYVQVSTKLN